ncbi:16280_t:CDS:2 [Funneliformis geosporum]|nr:16280_t:CDS:2 [Funneliformis geosporum]
MEIGEIKELLLNELTKEQKYSLNTKQAGEASELLNSLADNSANLVFLDPQYEKVGNVLSLDYPLHPQSDYQILRILEQIQRILKPTPSKRKHPHQKPKKLIKALIEATTNQGDLVVDPCAGSFIVLEVCRELKRDYLGVDLTFREMKEF